MLRHYPRCAALAALLCALAATGCGTAPPSPPMAAVQAEVLSAPADLAAPYAAQYAALAAQGGRVLRLRPEASQVHIYVFRAAGRGHNHVLTAPQFEGWLYWPGRAAAQPRFDLQFRLDQLVLDRPEERAALGPGFAAPLSEAAIAATRDNMLGPKGLQAERYPLLTIQAREVQGEAPWFSARVAVTLHGQTRELRVPLQVSGLPEHVQASGSLVLRQSDFGLRPYSALGGLLAVQDDVVVAFTLLGD